MIAYRLDDLGWFEFEQLVQTLIKARLGLGIEAWGGRGDWGRDAYFEGKLRYPTNDEVEGPFVFQSKFVENANSAGANSEKLLRAAVLKERKKIRNNLDTGIWDTVPKCYAVFTNAPCSAIQRETLRSIFKKCLPGGHISIHDGGDICQWLRQTPEIVRSFPQLLSLRDLQELLRDVVHSDIIARSNVAITLAESQAKVFVPTSAYDLARAKLAAHNFVVLEGPPEMGKTTIGRIIAVSQVVCGWEAIECRSPTDVLKLYRQNRQQVFVADDFFGRTEYEPMRVSEWQSELAHILPLLGRAHWLILTCRAHLLEMAKAKLDIAGQNGCFPELGEIVVNAGDLKPGEKARILYRHAKAVGLNQSAKQIVKDQAAAIVNHKHFTPERIRRLMQELVPKLALDDSLQPKQLNFRISEALNNPTKQMRVSFRTLPASHRWLMFALLQSDHGLIFSGVGHGDLQSSYDTLCPPADHRPYKRVLDELTEGFIKKSQQAVIKQIDWIHPSCRDLAIDELMESSGDRQQFLSKCSEVGLRLATSIAGGAKGARRFPLLQTNEDWHLFAVRAEQLVHDRPKSLRLIWDNFRALNIQAEHDSSLTVDVMRLPEVIKMNLWPAAAATLASSGFASLNALKTLFEIRRDLKIQSEVDVSRVWADCLDTARSWIDDEWVIWQDDRAPTMAEEFLNILNEFSPSFFENSQFRSQHCQLYDSIVERVAREKGVIYSAPENTDEASQRADCYYSLGRHFEKLAAVPIWSDAQRTSLYDCAAHFRCEGSSLSEGIPPEPDDDDGPRDSSAPSEDMNINDLFRDL